MMRIALAAALILTPLAAGAQTLSTSQSGTATRSAPPADANAQFWIDPRTGCSYTRAQVGNYAPTWHLIRNGARIGLTNGRISCAGVIRSSR